LPDRITIDDALGDKAPPQASAITFDDALQSYESKLTTIEPGLGKVREALAKGARGSFMTYDGRAVIGPKILPPEESHFGASVKQGIPEDLGTRRKVLAESLFPDDPNGVARVGFVDDKPVYVDDEGKLRYVSGGVGRFGAGLVSNSPEIVGSVIGSFATGNPVTGAALGGAGGRGLKRGISALAFDEPVTTESVATEMATEGAVNVAGGLVGKGVAKFSGRGRVADFTPAEIKTAEQAREHIKTRTGIDVDLAQASGNRKLIALRAYAARFPGKSAEIVQAADEAAEGQLDTAVNRTLDLVAKATPQETAYANGVTAAQMVIKTAREKVYNETRPLYEAAYKSVPEITDRGILDMLELPYFGQAFSSGQRIAKLEGNAMPKRIGKTSKIDDITGLPLNEDGTVTLYHHTSSGNAALIRKANALKSAGEPDVYLTTRNVTDTGYGDTSVPVRVNPGKLKLDDEFPDGRKDFRISLGNGKSVPVSVDKGPDLRSLDYTKRALDDKIETLVSDGKRQEARALQAKRDEFVGAIDAIPNQQWQLARQRYGALIKENVDPLEQGPVGVLAKIENPRFATRAAQILSDRNITPEQIRATRASIESAQPEAWNGLVRQYIATNWNKALKETQGGQVVNPAGKLRQALMGTPTDKARMQAMLPPAAVTAFDDLMMAAEALARTPIAGSNTMRDLEIKEQLKGNAALVFRWLTSPRQSIREAAEQKALERATVAITEGIIDPTKRAQLRQVVKMAPSTKQAILITGILTGQGAQSAVESDPTIVPEAYP
jgi:hypothetical protein